MSEENYIWICENCSQIYSEYVNGCPKCEQANKSWGVNRRHKRCIKYCSGGSGVQARKHNLGCPDYSSGHSIDVSGNCNMGCC